MFAYLTIPFPVGLCTTLCFITRSRCEFWVGFRTKARSKLLLFFGGRCSLISLIRSWWNDHKTTAMPSCHNALWSSSWWVVGSQKCHLGSRCDSLENVYPGSIFVLLNLVLSSCEKFQYCNEGRSKLSLLNQYKRSFCYFSFPGSFVPPSKMCFELDQPQEEE